MMGAFVAWMALQYTGLNYWWALAVSPLVVGASGTVIERFLLRRLYDLDHLYGLLLTFGLALVIEGVFRQQYGAPDRKSVVSGKSVSVRVDLGGRRIIKKKI